MPFKDFLREVTLPEALRLRCLFGVERFNATEKRFKPLLRSGSGSDPHMGSTFDHQRQAAEELEEMAAGVEIMREGLPEAAMLVSCTLYMYLAPYKAKRCCADL